MRGSGWGDADWIPSALGKEEILQGQSAVSQYWAPAEVQDLPSPGLSFLVCKMACFL